MKRGQGAFAAEWIAAWTSHDLERILVRYTDDFAMQSSLIIERMGVAAGVLKGNAGVRPYWEQGLAAQPNLHLELRDILVSVDTMARSYLSATRNRMVAESYASMLKAVSCGGALLYGRDLH